MTYKMRPFDEGSIAATAELWKSELTTCTEIFPDDVSEALAYIASNSVYDDHKHLDSIAYGIFPEDEGAQDQAVAIIKVIVSQAGKRWIKMIDCHISPKIEEGAAKDNKDDLLSIYAIYGAAIVGSFELTGVHQVNTVKVYGRTQSLLRMITTLSPVMKSHIGDENLPLQVGIEGRWLVVGPKAR